ncbi:MAG: DUF433 domain-containing protein [bacterium]
MERLVKSENGAVVVRGTQITVALILDLFYDGLSVDDILQVFPQLTRNDVLAALDYAKVNLVI